MSTLPPSPFMNSAASPVVAESAAVDVPPPRVAAAEPIAEPPSNEGRPSEAPAPRCTEPHNGAGALADRIDWHAFFEAVMDERIILFELTNDVPLFIRDGLHLRRWNA